MTNIFFSIAQTSDDRNLFERLLRSLSVQRRQNLIEVLYDSLISAGNNKNEAIKAYIRDAHIVVLLMSPDFFDSDQCINTELQYALEQQKVRPLQIIPVLLRPTEWKISSLERFNILPSTGLAVSIWNDLDTALLDVVKGIRQVASELAHRLPETLTLLQPAQFPLWTLPYRQNPFFTDRKDILDELHRSFTSGQHTQIRTHVLHGLAGVGKTTIAMEYTHRKQYEYQNILWINATPTELLSANIITVTDQLGIPRQNGSDMQQRFAAIRHWLRNNERWLVVLDNLEDFTFINQIIPLQGSGHVLLLTHTQEKREVDSTISVPQMPLEEGALLLLRRANIISEQGSSIATSETFFFQARAIAQAVEGYPIALDLAGAYIKETQQTPAAYLKRYRWQQWKIRLLHTCRWFTKDQSDPITTTLTLTYKKIARLDPNALEMLHFFAFLHPDPLPYGMITDGATALSGHLHSIATNPLALADALATLQRFSLVHHRADSTTLNMHSIVQSSIREMLTKKQQRHLAKQVVCLVNFIFPEVQFNTWEACERYLPQAQYCSTLIHSFHLTLEDGGQLLERLGFYYYQRGCYAEANIYLTQALRLQEQHQPENSSDIAQTLNSLGLLSQRQGRYQDARVLHQRALELRERIPDHPQIAQSLYNIAVLYENEGQYGQAEQCYLRVLSLDEQRVGPDHPDTAKTLNNLALIYYLQGYYPKAETTYQRALTIYENALSPDDPDLTYTLNGQGTLAEKRGDDQRAAELYQRALTIREQTLGKGHSETAHSINKWARVHELRGDYQQAQDLYQQALAIGEKKLGPEHPDIAIFLNNLALLAYKQERYQQAKPLYRRALSIYELAPNMEQAARAQVLNNLGLLYRKTKNEAQAEALLRQALAIREQVPGMTHPDTAQSLSNLGDLLTSQHRYTEAELLFKQALAILLEKLDPTYLEVKRVQEKYASLLELIQKSEEDI